MSQCTLCGSNMGIGWGKSLEHKTGGRECKERQLARLREQRDALRDASSRALTQLTGLTILMQDCAARDEVNSVYDGIVAALALCGE